VRQTRIVNPRLSSVLLCSALSLLTLPVLAQSSSSSSSSGSGTPEPHRTQQDLNPATRPRAAQIERGGAAVTLEVSEPLFELAAALNACGYDADLDKSAPVRLQVRSEMNEALASSETARDSRDKLCAYITLHHLNDTGLNVGQYVSLALYLSPPPELTPNVDETELPPQAASVVNVLPLLRDFSEAINLHYIWLHHHADYEALTARVHDPMEQMIQNTNIYLHQPVSTYDGRRFLVLLEPMLSPNLTNARVYANDYIIVMSPDNTPVETAAGTAGDPVRMDQIRHIYLHYIVEPLVYSRGSAMERMQPLLRGVQDAPLEFFYKSDVVALITECLIKAIEAHLYVIDTPRPKRPSNIKARTELDLYNAEKAAYDRETVLAQQKLVRLDDAQGWVETSYFYEAMAKLSADGQGLRDEIAPMIYGMDVSSEQKHAQEILFVKTAPGDVITDPMRPAPQPRKITGMDRAEFDLMKGDTGDAADLAEKALADPNSDHGRATYVLARIDLMDGNPDKAQEGFQKALTLTKDPRTIAWTHIYLGRLYDIEYDGNQKLMRDQAIAEYKTALANRDSRPDTKAAAEAGIAKPFEGPKRTQPGITPAKSVDSDDDKSFDPTGKAEKDAYKPAPPK
jgi:tetratricopeptide (TPR) repeat protein